MTRTSSRSGKGWRRPAARLRTLDERDLHAVTGGFVIYGSTSIIFWSTPALGGPDTSGGTVSGGGPRV